MAVKNWAATTLDNKVFRKSKLSTNVILKTHPSIPLDYKARSRPKLISNFVFPPWKLDTHIFIATGNHMGLVITIIITQ